MDKLRVGIIGVGNMGSAHAKNIYEGRIEHMRLAALCDTDAEKRMRCNSFWPDVAVFDNADDLLASGLVDAVIIATPHYYHPPLAIRAFEAGCHVLTEKPVGVSLSAAVHMSEAADKSGKVFGIMFNQRTDPLFSRAREIVRSGELGQPKRLTWIITNWYRTQHYYDSGDWRATWSGEGGGVLLNQAPHNLDIWQWIFGMPESVRAVCRVGQYHHIEVEDEATIYARYSDGAFATFITSTGEYPGTNRLEIVGDRAKLVLEGGAGHSAALYIDPTEEEKITRFGLRGRSAAFALNRNVALIKFRWNTMNLFPNVRGQDTPEYLKISLVVCFTENRFWHQAQMG